MSDIQKSDELKKPDKIDKRKITAKENLRKAREAKLKKLKEEKSKPKIEYEIVESSDDESSDSEDEVIVVKGNKQKKNQKPIKTQPPKIDNTLAEEVKQMKEILEQLTVKKKKKKEKKKKVIQVLQQQPTITPKPNPEVEAVKKRILLNL